MGGDVKTHSPLEKKKYPRLADANLGYSVGAWLSFTPLDGVGLHLWMDWEFPLHLLFWERGLYGIESSAAMLKHLLLGLLWAVC